MLPAAADSFGPAGSVGEPATEPVPVRPLQFRELIDLPFALIQTRITMLATLFGIGVAVASALAVTSTVLVSLATGDSDAGVFWAALLTTLVCAWALRMFVRGITVPVGLAAVHNQPITWRWAVQQLASEAGPLLGYQVMYTLIGVGVLALGAPLLVTAPLALLWLLWLRARQFATVPAIFDESAAYRIAAARSKLLVSGAEWRLVGVLMYLRGLVLVLLVPFLVVPGLFSDIAGTRRWTVTVMLIVLGLFLVAFAEMVESAAQVVSYVDRRCRREAWDIRWPEQARR
ncbi:hypothetical protein [Nocardia sp. NPDC127526]|uniref:hypothetical protein n=1 Tax=Nocardia sp. NPDC127526 TaxID=3345393 RepID=UPI003631D660